MSNLRLLTLFTATALIVGGQAIAQNSTPPPAISPTINIKLEDFTNPRPQGLILPLGINYSSNTHNLVMPLDAAEHWDIGVNLDIGNAKDFNTSSGLGVEVKSVPGLVLQHNF